MDKTVDVHIEDNNQQCSWIQGKAVKEVREIKKDGKCEGRDVTVTQKVQENGTVYDLNVLFFCFRPKCRNFAFIFSTFTDSIMNTASCVKL